MELEIRARIIDPELFKDRLNSLDGVVTRAKNERQVDTYIKHGLDKERVVILRIRRKEGKATLTFKKKSIGKDILWKDIDIPLDDPDRLEDILLSSGYVYVVLIDKVRDSYRYHDYEINFDTILNLGTFVEIEFISEDGSNIDDEVKKIKELLCDLGCSNDDIIEKGYVKLMEERDLSQ
jgi:predicted adenylyl cyclase CyaB